MPTAGVAFASAGGATASPIVTFGLGLSAVYVAHTVVFVVSVEENVTGPIGRPGVAEFWVSLRLLATKAASAALAQLSGRPHLLVVLERDDVAAWKSLRNVDTVHLLVADQLNTYDVLVSDDVVFTRGALEAFLSGPAKGKGAKAVATESEAVTTTADTDGSVK